MGSKRAVLDIGERVLNGRYEVLKVIHSSGMANVYLVQDNSLNKSWCMKEIKKSNAGRGNIEYLSILNEANILKRLNNPNIPRIVTIESQGDSLFIIMDYVDGMSVKDWLMRSSNTTGKVPQDIAVNWIKQVCQIMIYLHNRKKPIFYRDMKPDNIMIQSDGSIKLIDFGISVEIEYEGMLIDKPLGTNGFASPEQSRKGTPYDLRSDIYSIGRTLYFMLTGLNPAAIKGTLKPIRELDATISVGLDMIVSKCCAEDPNNRYQSCEELMYALQNYQKLDSKYRSKLRNKVYIVGCTFISSIFLMIFSLIPYNMYKNEKSNEYQNLLITAEQTGNIDDYKSVLSSKQDDIRPYLGLVDSIKRDGLFTQEEEQVLLNYVNPNIDLLKNKSDYGMLCYNIGKLYWFYYEDRDNGMIVSSKWFNEAYKLGYSKDEALVYYNLGSFKKNILSSITESEDSGMYAEYWGNLIKAKSINTGELVSLQVNLEIARCISTYSYSLMKDGITKEDIENQISELNLFIEQYVPSNDSAEVNYNELVSIVPTLEEKVSMAFAKGGK